MTKYIYTLVLSLLITTTAQASSLICAQSGVTTTTIEITDENFTLTEVYNGSFPTHNVQTGPVTIIDGEFHFVAYNVASKLIVTDSVGELTIGDHAAVTLNCESVRELQ
ncbi:MAG: hypothetical protein V4654_00390 [Bdellovibrionota bacterium]